MAGETLPRESTYFVEHLRELALAIRGAVVDAMRGVAEETLASPVAVRGGDTIYQLDVPAEVVLERYCEQWGQKIPFLLIAEGLESGARRFPKDAPDDDLAFTLIVDPVDGTRGLMYGKRSAWALLAVAPPPRENRHPTLADVAVALQAELPTPRAALADLIWAARGEGVHAETHDLRTGEAHPFAPRPSQATTLAGGFATITKFFPGTKSAATRLEESLFLELLGPAPTDSPQVFDDEYISSGGELYELMTGHDRFIADLRPALPSTGGRTTHLCAHPYDLCTALIANEAGVVVTGMRGEPLNAPLDTTTPVGWIGYANEGLRQQIEPILLRLLRDL